MSVTVTPADAVLGAEIEGVTAGPAMTERELLHIRDALLRHSVVVVRGQDLTPDDQIAFMDRLYGIHPPFSPTVPPFAVPGKPQIQIVSNIVEDGKNIGISDAGLLWHSDTSSFPTPELFVSLFALEIPLRDGVALGDTLWTGAIAAYEALPDAIKAELAGRRVSQSFAFHIEKMRAHRILTRGKEAQTTPNISHLHPVVRTHPITGRKLLYVNESYSEWIEGLAPERSQQLLEELWAHLRQPRFLFRHRWCKGDFVIWDNCATQHLATFDYGSIPRRLHRCGSDGPVPA